MAGIQGSRGVIYVGGTAVGCVTSWTLDMVQNTVDTTCMQDVAVPTTSQIATTQTWTATLTANWGTDGLATEGENAPTALPDGTTVTLTLWPHGETTGYLGYDGDAIVTGWTLSSETDSLIEVNMTLALEAAPTVTNAI